MGRGDQAARDPEVYPRRDWGPTWTKSSMKELKQDRGEGTGGRGGAAGEHGLVGESGPEGVRRAQVCPSPGFPVGAL